MAGLRQFISQHLSDPVLSRLQQQITAWTQQVCADPIVGGSIQSFLSPKASGSDFTVYHQLGRRPVGWQLTDKLGSGDIWTSPTVNQNPQTQWLFVASTGTLSGSVRFF